VLKFFLGGKGEIINLVQTSEQRMCASGDGYGCVYGCVYNIYVCDFTHVRYSTRSRKQLIIIIIIYMSK